VNISQLKLRSEKFDDDDDDDDNNNNNNSEIPKITFLFTGALHPGRSLSAFEQRNIYLFMIVYVVASSSESTCSV
jgi:hypothetical protein